MAFGGHPRFGCDVIKMKNHAKSRTLIVSCLVAALVVVSAAALLLLRRRNEPALPRPMAQPVPGKEAVKPIVLENVAHAPMVAASTSRAVAVVCGADMRRRVLRETLTKVFEAHD